MTQEQKVLEHLQKHGSIDPATAYLGYSIYRLSAIIYSLKRQGFAIETVMESGKNRFGTRCRWAVYHLRKGEA